MFVVAGTTGRTGRVVAERLLARGEKVRAIVRDPGRALAGTEIVQASLDDEAALAGALVGARGFYALLPEDPAVADFHGHRRRMADALAAAVRRSGVPHVVFLSALAAALAEGNGPAKDLHYAENALRASGASVTVIRATYFQDNVLGAADSGVYPSFLPADSTFPMVAARDIGRMAARLLEEAPRASTTIDLLGPAYSIRDAVARLGRARRKTIDIVEVPPAQHVAALTGAGLSRAFAEALAEMFACFAAGRVTPQGDRLERGTTELDELLGA